MPALIYCGFPYLNNKRFWFFTDTNFRVWSRTAKSCYGPGWIGRTQTETLLIYRPPPAMKTHLTTELPYICTYSICLPIIPRVLWSWFQVAEVAGGEGVFKKWASLWTNPAKNVTWFRPYTLTDKKKFLNKISFVFDTSRVGAPKVDVKNV